MPGSDVVYAVEKPLPFNINYHDSSIGERGNFNKRSFFICAVMGEVVSKVESELLCRAFINMYLGDDPFDKEAKDRFGMSLIALF